MNVAYHNSDGYRQQLISQLQGAFFKGKPIVIRCLSAIALNWTPLFSSLSFISSSQSSVSLRKANLPSLPLEPPIYLDCLVQNAGLLEAVECATTEANSAPHQWAINTKGQLVRYEWRSKYSHLVNLSLGNQAEWICLRDSNTIENVEKDYFGYGRFLKFVKCPQLTANETGVFNFTVMDNYDFRKLRSEYYDREHALLKKKRVLFAISSAQDPELCLTCPQRQGSLADKDTKSFLNLTPCNLTLKEQLPTNQLFYLEHLANGV